MQLRMLKEKDAAGMVEWMHDRELVRFMDKNFSEKSIDDCKGFIGESQEMEEEMNLAVVDDNDEYMGTVSLKNIDRKMKCAEFAIAMRRSALGGGYAAFGMQEIIRRGKAGFGLKYIYWCVPEENKRAIRFYDKNGYCRVWQKDLEDVLGKILPNEKTNLLWYLAGIDREGAVKEKWK